MTKNDFSERLQRIEAKKGAQPQQPTQPAIRSTRRNPSPNRAGMVIALMICLTFGAIGAMFVFERNGQLAVWKDALNGQMASVSGGLGGLPSFEEVILESALDSQSEQRKEQLAAAAEERARTLIAPPRPPREIPVAAVATERRGPVFGDGFAATLSATPAPVETIMTGFQPTGPDTPMGNVAFFDHNEGCWLRPIGAQEKFINVNITSSIRPAPVQLLNSVDIQDTLRKSIKEALEDGHSPGLLAVARGGQATADVIITDTTGPLYVVLQTLSANMIWHVHAAPGVEIAHIAMLSNGASGLTGNIGNATFEAIRASDFGNQMNFYDFKGEPEELECMARPFRKPDETWGAWEGAKGGNSMDGNLLFGQDNGFDAYDYWFTQTLGRSSTENLISANQAGVILVGDVPTTPITAPTQPSTLYISRHDRVLVGTAAEREAQTVSIYTDIVRVAAGGDHRGTIPPATEVSAPVTEAAQVGGERRDFGDLIMNRNNVEKVVSLTDLNSERRVSFSDRITWEDMLAPGEAPPQEGLRRITAMLRAPKLMQAYCTNTLVEIASKCEIFRATVHDSGDDVFQVRADFAYIPNYAIGDVTRISSGEFITAHLPDQREGRTNATPQERRAFLVELKQVCDELRKEYDNCLITTAGFYLDRPTRTSGNGDATTAAGWVSVYANDNRFEEGNLLEKAEEIMARVQAQ